MFKESFEVPEQTKTNFQRGEEKEKIKALRLEIEQNPNQQNKIIRSFRILSEIDNVDKKFRFVSNSQKPLEVTEEEREKFLKRLAENKIKDEHFKKIIEIIKAPAKDKDQLPELYKKIEVDERMKAIIAKIVLKDAAQKHAIIQKDIELLFKKYPNPIDFEQRTESYLAPFIRTIEGTVSIDERIKYQISLKYLKTLIYGKQQEYWNQIKLLKKEAEKKNKDK